MAKIAHCGRWVRATEHRIKSNKPAYLYQRVYEAKCKGKCQKKLMYWCGEYPNGALTDLYQIPREQFPEWKKRITLGKPKPRIQMTSDYTLMIKGPIEKQIEYQRKLRWAKTLKPIQQESPP